MTPENTKTTSASKTLKTQNLYEQALGLIDDAKRLRLQLHQNGQDQVTLQREVSLIKLAYQDRVNKDKTLTNEPKRKTALSSLLNEDTKYVEYESRLIELQNEAALTSIDIRYVEDMLKLLYATLSAGFTSES